MTMLVGEARVRVQDQPPVVAYVVGPSLAEVGLSHIAVEQARGLGEEGDDVGVVGHREAALPRHSEHGAVPVRIEARLLRAVVAVERRLADPAGHVVDAKVVLRLHERVRSVKKGAKPEAWARPRCGVVVRAHCCDAHRAVENPVPLLLSLFAAREFGLLKIDR